MIAREKNISNIISFLNLNLDNLANSVDPDQPASEYQDLHCLPCSLCNDT